MKPLSLKQKKFARDFVDTNGNATEAAHRNYNTKNRNTAKWIGHCNLRKPQVVSEIERLLDQGEVKDELLVQRLREGLDAKVVSSYKGVSTETKIPDLNTRFKYWEAAAKIKQYFPAQQVDSRSLNIDLQLESMSREEFIDTVKSYLRDLQLDGNQHIKLNSRSESGKENISPSGDRGAEKGNS